MNALELAEIAALVGDPTRVNMLLALLDDRALTAGELAYAARVSAPTASGHLARLTAAQLLTVVKQGRSRYYRIATPLVASMLEGIMAVAAQAPPRYRPRSKADDALRFARTCYNHLAGRLGVGLADALCARGHVVLTDEGGEVTESGVELLAGFGIDLHEVRRRRRTFCRPCLDWTERRPHLGGNVGASLASRCFALGWIERHRDDRALTITPAGQRGFQDTFGFGPIDPAAT